MKQALYIGAASALAVMVGFSGGANATTAVINGITVTNPGLANPLSPDYPQPAAYSSSGAKINFGTSNGGQSNNGWDPFGPSDSTHHWWNIGETGGNAGFNLTGKNLNIVWGSPNDLTGTGNNTVTFYSGLGGTGSLLGSVTTPDLVAAFGVVNQNQPGYLFSFGTPSAYSSVVFSTGPTAFEFAIAAPELSTWFMMLAGFAGLGFVGYSQKRKEVSISA
jgi:hypothetical protein